MNWIDSGFLLSKNKINENSVIAEIYTENHGKSSGIMFGASSKKIKKFSSNIPKFLISSVLQNIAAPRTDWQHISPFKFIVLFLELISGNEEAFNVSLLFWSINVGAVIQQFSYLINEYKWITRQCTTDSSIE